jgi:hypothetical protein
MKVETYVTEDAGLDLQPLQVEHVEGAGAHAESDGRRVVAAAERRRTLPRCHGLTNGDLSTPQR